MPADVTETMEEETHVETDADEQLMRYLEKQLSENLSQDSQIDYKTFKRALKLKDSYFGERFFKIFDKDKSNTIEVSELIIALRQLTKGSSEEKLKFLFDVYDESGDGSIDIEELRTALRSCMVESSVKLGDEELDMLTQALFEDADEDNNEKISFEELKAAIERHPGIKENLCISVDQWLKPPAKEKKKKVNRHFTMAYIINNLRKITFTSVILILNIILYIVGCWNYRTSNWFIILARGGGLCLNFDCTLIVVLVLRKCITWLRATPVSNFLPLDQHIMFHKLVGILILVFSLIHTAMHVGNAVLVSQADYNLTVPEFVFTTKANIGWVAGLSPLTGVILLVILIVMFICSMPFVRRSGSFELFYWTHMLYVPFWILLILHGTVFWMWFVVPGLMFVLEKIFRSKVIKRVRFGTTYIREVNLLSSEVTHLIISRPANMHFRPGDYLFIQIPAIARSEWHPFTISSAPEMEDKLWLHIRSAGHWTKKLFEYFNTIEERRQVSHDNKGFDIPSSIPSSEHTSIKMNAIRMLSGTVQSNLRIRNSFKSKKSTYRRKATTRKLVNVQCYLDGPYGTSSRDIFDTEHAVLIGSGIGVTPYASILQSIMYRFKGYKRCCPQCDNSWYDDIPQHVMKLKKVDFIWINRDQKSFEWFVSLLAQLEMEQTMEGGLSNFLEMHMFMTAALNKTDMKGIGLQMALDLIHKHQNKDLLTGLQTRTQPGRPNFQKLFAKIAAQKKGNVKVFFCGNPMLSKAIKHNCETFGFAFSKENF